MHGQFIKRIWNWKWGNIQVQVIAWRMPLMFTHYHRNMNKEKNQLRPPYLYTMPRILISFIHLWLQCTEPAWCMSIQIDLKSSNKNGQQFIEEICKRFSNGTHPNKQQQTSGQSRSTYRWLIDQKHIIDGLKSVIGTQRQRFVSRVPEKRQQREHTKHH